MEERAARRIVLSPDVPQTAARILALAGWETVAGGEAEHRAVWNGAPAAPGEVGLAPLHLGDPGRIAGLRLDPGTDGRLGLSLAGRLDAAPPDDTALLDRARAAIARMSHWGLATAPLPVAAPARPPDPGYVLVLDEPAGGARRNDIQELLFLAAEDNPGQPVLVLAPEDGQLRDGDFGPGAVRAPRGVLLPDLLAGARAVYTVAAPAGFDAIMAGHRPVVTGDPFYAGRGLTDDRGPLTRGRRPLTRAQLFAMAMIETALWYDPHRDALCDIGTAISAEAARLRAARQDARGHVAAGFSLWKRGHVARMLGGQVRFVGSPARAAAMASRMGRPLLLWGSAMAPAGAPATFRVEDGFLRSRGLGARLVPPVSLAVDDLGIYHDPRAESRLERLIGEAASLPPAEIERAAALVGRIRALGLTKYNIDGGAEEVPPRAILVPGQVEDDASILHGAGEVRTNLALLKTVREANPDAVILYKPHPDVEAGLRRGKVPAAEVLALADRIVTGDPARLLAPGLSVWTITSLLGFEALIRGLPVTTLGAPFYAGWGLTRDLGVIPARRTARPGLMGLAHAALIGYPRYVDPATGLPCPPEVAVERLVAGEVPDASGLMARLQGLRATLLPR